MYIEILILSSIVYYYYVVLDKNFSQLYVIFLTVDYTELTTSSVMQVRV